MVDKTETHLADQRVSHRRSGRGSRWLYRLLGVGILVWLLVRVDLEHVGQSLTSLALGPFVAACALTVPFFALKVWRWQIILNGLGIRLGYRQSVRMFGAGLFIGQATPGQLGELIRAQFLWRRGYDELIALGSVLLDRLIDLLTLAAIALPGLAVVVGKREALAAITGLAVVLAGVVAVRPLRPLTRVVGALGARPRFASFAERLETAATLLGQTAQSPTILAQTLLLSALALAVNFLRFYLLLMALKVSLPMDHFVFGVALANLAGLVPVTIAGVGFRDAVLIYVFREAGQSAEAAISFSLLILFVAYALNIVWGFPAWWKETR